MNNINKIDIFGITPKFFVDNKEKYQTKFGSFLTILLLVCVILSCWVYGKDMYYRENPKTTFSEQITMDQEKFQMNKNTFNFGVSLQNLNWEHYIDESVYTLKIVQSNIKTIKSATGEVNIEYETVDLEARKCTVDDFQIDTQYFTNLGIIDNLYCPGKKEYYIKGDWGADEFSSLHVDILPCKPFLDEEQTIPNPVQCKSQEYINSQLAGSNWAIYFTDQILDPKRYSNPFQPTGRDVFGITQNTMYKQVDFYFRNIYLEDNVGIIFDSIEQKKGLSFQFEKEFSQNTPLPNEQFLKFVFRFEKTKETKIYRTYLNLAEVLAQVGGVLKVLMIGFMIISWIVSQKLYNLKLANDVFNFQTSDNKQIIDNKKEQYKMQESQQDTQQSKKIKNSKRLSQDKEYLASKNKNLHFSNMFEMIFPCSKKNKEKQELLKFAVDKLSDRLNMNYVLNKMMEIEKLKLVLLSEEQQQLFDYIPKPNITPKLTENLKKQQTDKSPIKKQKTNLKSRNSMKFNNILLENVKTTDQKTIEAYEAFKLMGKNQYKKRLDCRILELMDKEVFQEFEQKLGEKIEVEIKQKPIDSQMLASFFKEDANQSSKFMNQQDSQYFARKSQFQQDKNRPSFNKSGKQNENNLRIIIQEDNADIMDQNNYEQEQNDETVNEQNISQDPPFSVNNRNINQFTISQQNFSVQGQSGIFSQPNTDRKLIKNQNSEENT